MYPKYPRYQKASGLFLILIITAIISTYAIQSGYLIWQQNKLTSMEQGRLHQTELIYKMIDGVFSTLNNIYKEINLCEIPSSVNPKYDSIISWSMSSLDSEQLSYNMMYRPGAINMALEANKSINCLDSIIYRLDIISFIDRASVDAYYKKMYLYLYICEYIDYNDIEQQSIEQNMMNTIVKQRLKAFPVSNILID